MNRLCIVFCLSLLVGCVPLGSLSPELEDYMITAEKRQEPSEVENLQVYLENGWELFLYEDRKLILVKEADQGLLIKDIFNVLD